MTLQHSLLKLSKQSTRLLVFCLIILQVGFVNAEPLWMTAAEVEHHHLFKNSDFAEQFLSSEHHQNEAHHCDVCHGHTGHFVVIVSAVLQTLIPVQAVLKPEYQANYSSLGFNSIYRPPIAPI